jgi:hypothetical protein
MEPMWCDSICASPQHIYDPDHRDDSRRLHRRAALCATYDTGEILYLSDYYECLLNSTRR